MPDDDQDHPEETEVQDRPEETEVTCAGGVQLPTIGASDGE